MIRKTRQTGVELSPENIEGIGGVDLAREGELSTDSSDSELKVHLDSATRTVVTEDQVQVLTNKTIDADLNTVSDLELDNLKAGVLNVSTTLSGASDAQVASALAVKTYVDDKAAAQNEASEISVTPAGTIAATNVQAALVELDGDIQAHLNDTVDAHDASAISNSPSGNLAATDVQSALNELQGDADTNASAISSHLSDTTDAHDASAISVVASGTLLATDVQAALVELESEIVAASGSAGTVQTNLTNHINDTSDAHDASAISNIPSGNLAATDIQAAVNELQGDIDTNASNLTSHLNDSVDAHDASAISSAASGNLAATDVQGALNELQSDIDLRALTTGGSIITPARLDMKQDTEVNLSTYALTAANGQLCFSTDTLKTFVVKNSALSAVGGGSGSGINYILTPDADTGSTGWGTYKDAAGANPVDGTGGTALYTTFSTTTSSPLRGTTSFLITKTANNAQGEGINYDFTIDASDKGKVLQGSFEYQIASGTFADNDLSVWIYDVTNAALIQPAPYLIKNSTIIEKFGFEFQTAGNSTSYRLIIHCASTSASAYTVKMDNFNVGPQAKLYGSPISDWVSYTPTFTGFGTPTGVEFQWRRSGGSVEVRGRWTSGSPTAVEGRLSLPSGLVSADTSKIASIAPMGNYIRNNAGAAAVSKGGMILVEPSVNYVTFGNMDTFGTATANPFNKMSSVTAVITNTDQLAMFASVPIQGWSSSQIMSSDADTRVIAAIIRGQLPSSIPANTSFKYPTVFKDTHGAYNSTTGQFTAPVSGYYNVTAAANTNAGAGTPVFIFVNGVAQEPALGLVAASSNITGTGTVWVNAGDTIDVRVNSTISATGASPSGLTIQRVSGPSSIIASETVAALYTGAPPTGTLAAAFNTTTYGTKVKDSHNAYSAGTYTVPVSGTYDISAQINTNASYVAGNGLGIHIFINGVDKYGSFNYTGGTVGTLLSSTHIKSIPLLAGQLITIRSYSNGTTPTFIADAVQNYFSITRSGNF